MILLIWFQVLFELSSSDWMISFLTQVLDIGIFMEKVFETH